MVVFRILPARPEPTPDPLLTLLGPASAWWLVMQARDAMDVALDRYGLPLYYGGTDARQVMEDCEDWLHAWADAFA